MHRFQHMQQQNDTLATLVASVRASANYRDVCAEAIAAIGERELAKRRNLKEAIKATKNTLHQVSGAYLNSQEHYPRWLAQLRSAAQSGNDETLRDACRHIINYHASTRERLPILEHFYTTILAELPPVHSVLDIACGLNPLTLPWMPLANDVTYYACDIYESMATFLNDALAVLGAQGHCEACDVRQSCPAHKVDVALLLKAIPCLEQVEKHAGQRLLRAINANYIVVSYPVRSLGGKNRGMVDYYTAHFNALVANEAWNIQRFEFTSELVFLVKKSNA